MPVARRGLAALVAVGLVALVAGGCGNDGPSRDGAAFCGRLRLSQSELTDPSDPVALVALYQDLDDEAPLQIKDDWHAITELLGTVTSFDPTDEERRQELLREVLRSQAAVNAVATWASDTCAIELGAIPTAVPIGGTGDDLLTDAPEPTEPDPSASDTSDATDNSDASDLS